MAATCSTGTPPATIHRVSSDRWTRYARGRPPRPGRMTAFSFAPLISFRTEFLLDPIMWETSRSENQICGV